ncbi:MAG: thioesterase, partial [Ardenticatenales bacterium]|nr:thioesterase [Ardenticatenales bacterium]
MRPRPRPDAALRLFCLPYAGGGASLYWRWSGDLPPGVELVAIQLPGHESHMELPAFSYLDDLLPPCVEHIAPLLDKPFILFGHSMGALIGYELALYLQNNGYPQAHHLFVSAFRAPHVPDHLPDVHRWSDEELQQFMIDEYAMPREVFAYPGFNELMLPTLRADLMLCATHRCKSAWLLHTPLT